MTIGFSPTKSVRAVFISALCVILAGCGSDTALARSDDAALEEFPIAIVCLAYLDLQSDAVREARETGNLQSISASKARWMASALSASRREQIEEGARAAKRLVSAQSPRQIGDEAANCIARAPR